MFSITVVSTSVAGVAFLILGLIVVRKELAASFGLEKLIVLGPVFVAASLATFAAEHFAAARGIAQLVPAWMPWHLFWTYFFGVALLLAALSFDLKKCEGWSAPLLALMFLIFVLTMDLPGAISEPKNRFNWILLCREISFGTGGLALTAVTLRERRVQLSHTLAHVCRVVAGSVFIFYGIENILHPECVLGVPLEKLMPAWVLSPRSWAWTAGLVLIAAGTALLLNRKARLAAALVGLEMTLLTVLLYVPILAMDRGTGQLVEGINYVFDTLLFAGTALLIARAMPHEQAVPQRLKPDLIRTPLRHD